MCCGASTASERERATAEVRVVEVSPERIRLSLSAKTDSALYDEPLTLSTRVPADWKSARVTQGPTTGDVPAREGAVQYSALPGGPEILIQAGR